MVRRYHSYSPEFQSLNVMSSLGAVILGVSYVAPLVYLAKSFLSGEPAGRNPWQAHGLEWQTESPPPAENFLSPPTVSASAYEYVPAEPADA
jgi:cytochrome c oxidase subunit 1